MYRFLYQQSVVPRNAIKSFPETQPLIGKTRKISDSCAHAVSSDSMDKCKTHAVDFFLTDMSSVSQLDLRSAFDTRNRSPTVE